MVNVVGNRYNHRGCAKSPSYGMTGTTTAEFRSGHAKNAMGNVMGKRCKPLDCTNEAKYMA